MAMEFGQLIKYNKSIFFHKNYTENETGRLVPDLFLFFKKALFSLKGSDLHLSFNEFLQLLTWTYNKNKLYKIFDC